MEPQIDVLQFIVGNGFFPDQNPFGEMLPDSILDGANAWVRGQGLVMPDRGSLLFANSGGARPLMNVGGTHGGMSGGSGVVTEHAATTWFAGSGNALKGGAILGASAGRLYLMSGGVPVEAGLDAPTGAPVIEAGSASAKGLSGTYSVRLAAARPATGAESSQGPASAPISLNKKKIKFLSWPATVTGQTHWIIGVTLRGLGLVGPHFKLGLPVALIDAVAGYEIDFYDNELGDLLSFVYGKPPPCTHCLGLGPFMLAIGTDGGYGIRPSLPTLPEAYDVAHATALAVREGVTGVAVNSSAGVGFVSTRNSLSAVIVSGAEHIPILVRQMWGNTGFAHGNAWTVVDDEIYGHAGLRGPVRTQGNETPDLSFSFPVQEYMAANGFTAAATHVCADHDNDAIIFAAGNKALPFMRADQVWSPPITLPGTVDAAMTLGGQGLLSVGGALYALNKAAGNNAWFIEFPWRMGPGGFKHHHKTLRYWKATGAGALSIDIHVNGGGSTKTIAHSGTHSGLSKFRRRGVQSVRVRVAGTLAGDRFWQGELGYILEPEKR